MPRRREPEPLELIELDIDARLTILWEQIEENEGEFTLAFLSSVMRAAYAFGYCDALKEPDPGRWLREHGYSIPKRRAA